MPIIAQSSDEETDSSEQVAAFRTATAAKVAAAGALARVPRRVAAVRIA